ncbi:MAG: hypothetical protein KGO96_08570 [Elusimicrobia bacterium]|nr:hypothetical protein [Elusimicrobiota bacterium]MDE2425943.1 hypothetical protein [Elusimicrobiota bacterium]
MAKSPHEASVEDEIKDTSMGAPHVVLLGAGASRAAFPQGDRNGKALPLMADFVQHLGIGDYLREAGVPSDTTNFETAYSTLVGDPRGSDIREELETRIYEYFRSLEMPDSPTIYDHLLLAMRPKDVIATFNWDPFLLEAVQRNNRVLKGRVPALLFLHGNVAAGFCPKDRVHGFRGAVCSKCKEPMRGVPLLYPIAAKNYENDPSIAASWAFMKLALKKTFMFTVFGYGAPSSDTAALSLLREAWGDVEKRSLEQTEIIDIRPKEELAKTWEPFIHTHHYETHDDFFDSWIAKHPRRSGEAYWNQYMMAKFISNNRIPKGGSLEELWDWYQPLFEAEQSQGDERL